MSKDANRHTVLGEGRWGVSLLFFFLVIYIFSRQFFSNFQEVIDDPVYFFSVIMVALAVAAPALWIFNEGRRFFSRRAPSPSSSAESDLFRSLMELSEEYRVFQNLTLAGYTFDAIVVGPGRLSVIGVYSDKYQNAERGGEILDSLTRKKAEALGDFFGGGVTIDHILVGEKTRKDERSSRGDAFRIHGIIEPASLSKVLKKRGSGVEFQLSPDVLDTLDKVWKGE